jgi:hypothetical protein
VRQHRHRPDLRDSFSFTTLPTPHITIAASSGGYQRSDSVANLVATLPGLGAPQRRLASAINESLAGRIDRAMATISPRTAAPPTRGMCSSSSPGFPLTTAQQPAV